MSQNRRHFLKGLGGFSLAMPFLTSLAPRLTHAQLASKRRLIAIEHRNGIFEDVWYPQQEVTTANGFTAFAADVLYKQLSQIPRVNGDLSENFKKDFDGFLNKVNIYRGLDVIGGSDHDSTHFLCGMEDDANRMPLFKGASIDTLISNSSNFYPTAPSFRVLRAQTDRDWTITSSFERNLLTGTVTEVKPQKRPLNLFNQVFGSLVTDPAVQNKLLTAKLTIGDLVLEDYRRKMNSTRISSEDKIRLANFVDNLQEVQRKLASASVTQPVSCQKPVKPFDYSYFSLLTEAQIMECFNSFVDIMSAAIACDLTRVCTITDDSFLANHDYSHSDPTNREAQLAFLKYNRRAVQLVSRLATNLNSMVEDASTGKTLLDNSLIMWGSEISESKAHRTESMPLVTIGGAGGAFKTGYYIDYRKRPFFRIANRSDFPAIGRSYTQFLITVMKSMGLQPSEYHDYGDGGGFGIFSSNVSYSNGAYEVYRSARNQTLPFIANIT